MESAYSTIAVKYVGSAPAERGLETLRTLVDDGCVTLEDGAAVTRSTGGEMHYYPVQTGAPLGVFGAGAIGVALGLFLGRGLRGKLIAAILGEVAGVLASLLREQIRLGQIRATVPYVELNESVLYMRIRDAQWADFCEQIQPQLEEGKIVMRSLAPAHAELKRFLAADLEQEALPEKGRPKTARRRAQEETATATSVRERSEVAPDERVLEIDAEGSVASDETVEVDDLTAIKGIGPVFSERLREGGVRSFAKLAGMEIQEIAELAGVSETRVDNGNWIGQAANLAASE